MALDPMKGMIASYLASPKGQETLNAYLSSPEGQKAICEYVATRKGSETMKKILPHLLACVLFTPDERESLVRSIRK